MVRARWPQALTAASLCLGALAAQRQFENYALRAPLPFARGLVACSRGFAAGDLDGDGRRDLVIGQAARIEVLFAPSQGLGSIPVGGFAGAIRPILADLDMDGDLDVVQCPPRSLAVHAVVWTRNDGPAFVNQFLPASVSSQVMVSVAVGDFDGDGDPDLVCSPAIGSSPQQLVLLQNDGHGGFTVPAGALPTTGPVSGWLEPLDHDRDGDLDLMLLHTGGLRLLQNVGGSFVDATASLPTLGMQAGMRSFAVGDLDDDGFVDVAIPNNNRVDMLWGGAAGFQAQVGFSPTLVELRELDIADLDHDGHTDLVIARANGFDWARGLGNRQFTTAGLLDTAIQAHDVIDVDGDGAAELVFASAADPARVMVRSFAGPGPLDAGHELGFRAPPGAAVMWRPFAGDVDGDGRIDLLAHSDRGLIVNRARGDGRYTLAVSPSVTASSSLGIVRNLLLDGDADGDPDLVVATDNALTFYGNDGAGTFTTAATLSVPQLAADTVRTGDVDGDGRADLVFANSLSISLLRNLRLPLPSPTVLLSGAATGIELMDVDGDGDLDLVTNLPSIGGGSAILANTGGVFAANPQFSIPLGASSALRSGDLDGDGDQDLVCVANANLQMFVNDGLGRFTDDTAQRAPTAPTGLIQNLVLADFDDDGDLDVLGVVGSTSIPMLLQNDGTGHFVDVGPQRVGLPQVIFASNWDIGAADIDGDGDLDVLGRVNSISLVPYIVLANQLRQIRSLQPPRLGEVAHLDIYSGPGFGTPGVAWLGMALAQSATPLRLPWLRGAAELDPGSLEVVDVVPTSSIGVSSSFVAVPPLPALAGLEVWFQAAVLPAVGAPGLTNPVFERVIL